MTGVTVEQVDNPQSHPFQTTMGIREIHLVESEKYTGKNQRNILVKPKELQFVYWCKLTGVTVGQVDNPQSHPF